jgi:hypothetical protein
MTFDKWLCNYSESKDRNLYGEELETAKAAWEAAKPKWLPISEAPEFKDVLVKEITGHVYIAERQGTRWYQSIEREDIRVRPVKWMPLPT